MTREEICRCTGVSNHAACGRLNTMEHARLVEKVGRKEADSGVRVWLYERTQ